MKDSESGISRIAKKFQFSVPFLEIADTIAAEPTKKKIEIPILKVGNVLFFHSGKARLAKPPI
ncbi:hypothetical protein [Myxacorys almedinensis]|uniref:Uncharacterized protein n=1 Tax=Myxacorys almedinensis A TaxID=2690445 RepID=A0A8J8CPH7_9CYAN|nr:hypothetical protein [Myxacorys almedinensis]NDJ19487.1 hypothetical protein [Myxacorys almedinensis A]